ncbi:Uncharacterized protein APZ42_003642, partial [Daphnia magna]
INHYHVKPNFTAEIPKLIRIPNRIFEKETKALVDTGAAASLISSSLNFNISDKNLNQIKNTDDPIFRTVSGQELKSLGQYEFKITINKNHLINHNFYVMENLNKNCSLGLDFLASNNVKINTKNKQISYDHYGVEHSFSE